MSPLPAPGSPDAPKYWKDETSGVLAAAIRSYLDNPEAMTMREIAYVREYLRQWIDSPVWDLNPALDAESRARLAELRASAAKRFMSARAITEWPELAGKQGIDPL